MNVQEYEAREELAENENSHVFHMWTPLHAKIDENYTFVKRGYLFTILSTILYFIIYPILFVFNKVAFGFSIEGEKNVEGIQAGKITVSNHVHPMDCTMSAIINAPRKTYFPTLKSNMEIPIINWLIRLLNAIPIPDGVEAKKKFVKAINGLLQEGKTVHFYPEASLWPYCTKLRKFKKGAFEFAVENNVPIVPIVYLFEKPTNMWELFKSKPCIKAKVLKPIYPNEKLRRGEAVLELKDRVYEIMEKEIQKNKSENKMLK